jgi:predicted MFS family arabinose efflux permease
MFDAIVSGLRIEWGLYAVILITALIQVQPYLSRKNSESDDIKDSQEIKQVANIRLFLFLYFLATEFSRSFFPLFVKVFDVNIIDVSIQMGLPQMVWGLTALIATPFGYFFADKFGKKRGLIIASVLTAVAIAVMAMTNNYWVMLLSRAVMAGSYGVVSIIAVLHLSRSGKASSVAVMLSALAGASICGNAAGGLLTEYFSFRLILGISSLFAFIAPMVLGAAFENDAHQIPLRKAVILSKKLLLDWKIQLFAVASTMTLRFVLTGFVLFLLPIIMTNRGIDPKDIAFAVMLYFMMNAAMVNVSAWFLDKYQLYRIATSVSSALIAISLAAFYFSNHSLRLMFISVLALSIGMTLNTAVQVPIVSKIFEPECNVFGQDVLVAYLRTVERVGSVAGPLLASLALSTNGESAVALMSAGVVVMTIILIGLFVHQKARECLTHDLTGKELPSFIHQRK